MITAILTIILYALVACLILELVFWIIGLFLPVPPKIRQIVYAIVGVLFIIWIVQSLSGQALPSLHINR